MITKSGSSGGYIAPDFKIDGIKLKPGNAPKKDMKTHLKSKIYELSPCRSIFLHSKPVHRGGIRLKVTVDKDGKVVKVEILKNDMGKEIQECVVNAVGSWDFPFRTDGLGYTVIFSVKFGQAHF